MNPPLVHLHPNAVLSISDCLNRLRHSQNHENIGGLLGRMGENSTSILYSFEIPETEYTNTDSLYEHYELISQIYGKGYLELVGFYSIGDFDSSTLSRIASDSTIDYVKAFKPDSNASIIKLNLNDYILLELDVNDPNISDINQSWRFKNLYSQMPIKFDIKYTLSEQISMTTYNGIPQTTESLSSSVDSLIKTSFSEISTKLKQALLFLKDIENGKINIDNNPENNQKYQSLSNLAHKVVMLEELVKESNCSTDLDINHLNAIRSSYSSLMLGNL